VTTPAKLASRPPALSIVATLYNSQLYVEEFCQRATDAARSCGKPYEIILVDDGSADASKEIAVRLAARDACIRVIELSRNFGHHKAMMTGLAHARGAWVFLIDSDLEEDPEWLNQFFAAMQRENVDVVYGVQIRRKGGLLERIGGALYYATFNALLDFPLPRNVVTARLMTARYVSQLVRHRDREVCIAALWVMTGFKQLAVPVNKQNRGASTYGIGARLAVVVNAVTSFSNRPLVYIFYIGGAILFAATLAAGLLIWRVLFRGVGVAGWASLIVSVWFLGGVTIFSVGTIGMYLAKIFTETKERPYTVVRAYYPEPDDCDD
jgi:putative glycosyltransferase